MIEKYRDRMISEGISEVTSLYEEGSPKREGAVEGFELCRTLMQQGEFEKVLAARRAREQRMVAGFHLDVRAKVETDLAGAAAFKDPIVTTDDEYWRHRYATLQIELVHHRLLALRWLLDAGS
jgi:hypothetical protein